MLLFCGGANLVQYIRTYYRPLHGDLQELRNEFLDDTVLQALERGDVRSDLVQEVHPGVFRLPFFKLDFCKRLLEEIHHFEDWAQEVGLHINRPNSMNVRREPIIELSTC